MNELNRLGYARFEAEFLGLGAPHLAAARVASADRDTFTVYTAHCRRSAAIAGRLIGDEASRIAVGDWVAVADAGDLMVIEARLQRRTALSRKGAGRTSAAQVIAANVDTVFIVTAAGRDLNPRRIERFLALVYEGGASPVLVVNKSDLGADTETLMAALGPSMLGVPMFETSAETGAGVQALTGTLARHDTIVFVGSSGVGKSTLINRIAGETVASTGAIRAADQRGRHTTTSRSLWPIRDWVLIDTPGVRELGLVDADAGLDQVFADIDALSLACRFSDCGHDGEPGCAVEAAVGDGGLEPSRLQHYRQLRAELQAAAARSDARTRKRAGKRFGKMAREAQRWRKMRRGSEQP